MTEDLEGRERGNRRPSPRAIRRRLVALIVFVAAALIALGLVVAEHSADQGSPVAGPYPLAQLLASTSHAGTPVDDSILSPLLGEIPSLDALTAELTSELENSTLGGSPFQLSRMASEVHTCLTSAIELSVSNALQRGFDPAIAVHEVLTSRYCENQVFALSVLQEALMNRAAATGAVVSPEEATQYAEGQFKEAQRDDFKGLNLTAGQKPESVFLCETCILGYQRFLTIQRQIQEVGGNSIDASGRTTELAAWLAQFLDDHPNWIDLQKGSPFSEDANGIVKSLPSGL